MSFLTNSGTGGTGDLSKSGADCTAAPCSQSAEIDVFGTGSFGSQTVNYSLSASDPDPGLADYGTLRVNGTGYSFNCTGCVEVIMQPGSAPNGLRPT